MYKIPRYSCDNKPNNSVHINTLNSQICYKDESMKLHIISVTKTPKY